MRRTHIQVLDEEINDNHEVWLQIGSLFLDQFGHIISSICDDEEKCTLGFQSHFCQGCLWNDHYLINKGLLPSKLVNHFNVGGRSDQDDISSNIVKDLPRRLEFHGQVSYIGSPKLPPRLARLFT